MKNHNILVGCDEARAKSVVEHALNENGFKITCNGATGVAEKGNRIMRLFFGAFVEYHKVEFCFERQNDGTIVTLSKASTGFSGGLIGVSQVDKGFKQITEKVQSKFMENGIQAR